ncbi:MAG: energy transducer TonB [Wenzhouxiangella sp.]|nr:energy transducer TonB [Wenzhouxiangella sp.]TVR92900.1 MAG: energy transducer TonB [Wenzhouxiangellaceae bacterium]
MNTSIRTLTGLPLAIVVTVGLFLLLASVITRHQDVQLTDDRSVQINVTRQLEDRTQQRPEDFQRPVLDQPPPPPPMVSDPSFRPTLSGQIASVPDISTSIDIGTGFNPDRDAQPLVRIPPQYPGQCQRMARPLETVVVEFDVTPEGTVINPRVIDSTNSCFNRAAMRAVERWRYQPRIVNEVAQPRFGVRTAIDFGLE